MINVPRPDLSNVEPAVRAYIEALEAELERPARQSARSRSKDSSAAEEDSLALLPEIAEPEEPPTTMNIITATAAGVAKRTPRHLYSRQHRGGMGVFDLETDEDEPPVILAQADESQHLLLITSQARAFRLPVAAISKDGVRARGESIFSRFSLDPGETLSAILPDRAQGYVAMVSQRGNVRLLRHHVFGEYMKPGAVLYDMKAFGPLAAACWTPGDCDLFIATRQGKAIRFSEKLIPPAGGPGIRLGEGDAAVAITPVYDDSGVFLIGADGKGTIRRMEGFSPNKAPGAGGKIAFATDQLVAAAAVEEDDDIFVISRLSKIIRFRAGETPSKDGVVQGVFCMALRGDETSTIAVIPALASFQ